MPISIFPYLVLPYLIHVLYIFRYMFPTLLLIKLPYLSWHNYIIASHRIAYSSIIGITSQLDPSQSGGGHSIFYQAYLCLRYLFRTHFFRNNMIYKLYIVLTMCTSELFNWDPYEVGSPVVVWLRLILMHDLSNSVMCLAEWFQLKEDRPKIRSTEATPLTSYDTSVFMCLPLPL